MVGRSPGSIFFIFARNSPLPIPPTPPPRSCSLTLHLCYVPKESNESDAQLKALEKRREKKMEININEEVPLSLCCFAAREPSFFQMLTFQFDSRPLSFSFYSRKSKDKLEFTCKPKRLRRDFYSRFCESLDFFHVGSDGFTMQLEMKVKVRSSL